ncbi:MAG TPA: type II toxin-antitoxin system VapC family toxin [Tepidiformaceae bacterium]|nr:type II toxin-antitoxin system VapC family toxin [Tepidiformaceae bacterium]
MSAFLLDTVAISATRRPARNPAMREWMDVHAADDIYISAVSLGELERGIATARDTELIEQLRAWLAHLVESYAPWTLAFDTDVARVWGQRVGALARRGRVVPVVDAMLAATATAYDLVVVTRNTRDFMPFGVATVNPWEEQP